MVFFLSADDKVYARYGQRNGKSADALQSLKGLHYTMKSVLDSLAGEKKLVSPKTYDNSVTIREIAGGGRRCFHCHQVNEVFDKGLKEAGKWSREKVYRFPLPDNLGITLDVDRGNKVSQITADSQASKVGLQKGDVLQLLGGVPIHSIADTQFALNRAPAKGSLEMAWMRDGKQLTGNLSLSVGWRKSDIRWRPSLRRMIPSLPLRGTDLTESEKKAMGLPPKQLAFRVPNNVSAQAKAAGVQSGDVVLGLDEKDLPNMKVEGLREYVKREYLVGDKVQINVLREGKRVSLPITLR
jgi:S1-C subfamily serine protease